MSFSPSPQELALVSQLFAHADPQKLGILTGDAAVKAFQGANLSPVILGEVWALADSENNGFLTRKTAAIAVRLIGWAQKGETVSEALINKPGPLAHIEGVSRPVTSSPAPKSPTISSSASLPPLTPQDRDKFQRIFTGCGPVDGLLSGEKARDVFVKSKLPYEKLSQIWQLADTRNRGSLDSADFAVGMYLIQACMSNSSFVLPAVLPPSVYTQAGGLPPQVATHPTGGSGTFPSPSLTGSFAAQSIKPQLTGQSALSASGRIGRPAVPPIPARRALGSPFPNAAVSAFAPPPQPWDVSPEEKTTSDGFYDTLDTQHRGYIEGEVAVPFMIQSGLSEDILAQVWDLADIHNDGKLTRDGFAIAMHLINGQLAGKPLPPTLPPTLVPPSLRPQITGNQAPKPALSQVQQDLWGLDEAPQENAVSPPAAFTPNPLSAQTTGTNIRSPAFQPAAALPVHKTGQSFSTTFSTPFTPAAQAPPSLISSPPPSKDLLGDDEESATEHATIHANSVEIANTQNQLTSTERSLKSTQSERKTLEETLAAQASQLSALQSQLSTAKAAYEAETKLLATLRERLTSQNNDIQKTRNDLIRAESDLSAIKLEKSEIEGSFLRDKEEIRDLQRKMKEAGENIELLKADVEKAKKEARQQKGLLAIAKKQLGTSEAEKEKQQKELAEANAERDADAKETQEVETKIEAIQSEINSRAISPAPAEVAASIHIPDTPDMTSPLSTNSKKSTNPFEHLLFGGGGTPRSESPFQPTSEAVSEATQNREPNLVDDPFGLAEEPEQKEETSPPIEEPAASLEPSEPVLASKITTPFDEFLAESIGPEHKEEFEPPVASPLDAPVPGAFPSDEPAKAIEEKKTEFPELREIEPEEDDSSDDDDFHDANGLLPSHKTESRNGTPVSSKINEVSQAAQSHPAEAPIVAPVLEAPAAADVFAPSSEPWKPSAAASLFPTPPRSAAGSPARTASQSEKTTAIPPTEPLKNDVTGTNGSANKGFGGFSDSFSTPSSQTKETPAGSTENGINAFDEAMGISGLPTSNPPTFKFESKFDDDFDFNAPGAVASPFPPPPSASTTLQKPAGEARPFSVSFDTSVKQTPPASQTASPAAPAAPAASFNDIFGSLGDQPASNQTAAPAAETSWSFDKAFSPPPAGESTSSNAPMQPTRQSTEDFYGTPSPENTAPNSPTVESESRFSSTRGKQSTSPTSTKRSFAGVRSSSPPARSTSPPLRPHSPPVRSKSQSNEEKSKSKSILRFPFGRNKKDKHKELVESPRLNPGSSFTQHQLLPPVNEPSRIATPAVDDDTEPLKALCSMGFSRSQALSALETHNFDVQKALNSLLGSQ